MSTLLIVVVAALAVSTFATIISIQQANADNESNGNDPQFCDYRQQHSDFTNCSQRDLTSTPFILPFPWSTLPPPSNDTGKPIVGGIKVPPGTSNALHSFVFSIWRKVGQVNRSTFSIVIILIFTKGNLIICSLSIHVHPLGRKSDRRFRKRGHIIK